MAVRRAGVCAAAAVLLTCAVAGAATTSWRELDQPDGGSVTSVALGGDGTAYAGTTNGLFVSSDGASWVRRELPLADRSPQVLDVEATPSATAYVSVVDGEYYGHVYRTNDGGATWQEASAGMEAAWAWELAASSDRPGVVFAAASGDVFKTTDGAQTWHRAALVRDRDAPPAADDGDEDEAREDWGDGAATIVVDEGAPDTIYAGGYRGIYTSADGGAHWTKSGVGFPSRTWIISIAVVATTPRTFYAGTEEDGIFKSVDGGITWLPSRAGLPREETSYAAVADIALDPFDPGVVYAATSAGAAKSVDGGATWDVPGASRAIGFSSLAADLRHTGRLLAGSLDQGVLRSDDGAQSWRLFNENLTAVVPIVIGAVPGTSGALYVGTAGTGLFATVDGGATWAPVAGAPGRIVTAVAVDPKTPANVYAGTLDSGVVRTVDGGKSWSRAGDTVTRETPGRNRLSSEVRALAIDARHPKVLYAASQFTYGAGVYRSADGGASWQKVFETENSIDASIEALAVDPSRPGIVYTGTGELTSHMSAGSWGVFASRDGGATWKRIAAGLGYRGVHPSINALAVVPRTGDVLATTYVGVFRLARGASAWTRLASGYPLTSEGAPRPAGALAVNPRTGRICVGTPLGVYELRGAGGSVRWGLVSPADAGPLMWALSFSGDGSRLFAAAPGHFLVEE